jgi:hypothetical protein
MRFPLPSLSFSVFRPPCRRKRVRRAREFTTRMQAMIKADEIPAAVTLVADREGISHLPRLETPAPKPANRCGLILCFGCIDDQANNRYGHYDVAGRGETVGR